MCQDENFEFGVKFWFWSENILKMGQFIAENLPDWSSNSSRRWPGEYQWVTSSRVQPNWVIGINY